MSATSWLQVRRVRILGARVYLHWSVVAVCAVLALLSFKSPIEAAVSITSYLSVILLHEAGHACVAHRLGYAVDAIRIAFCHGTCEFEAPHSERDEVLICWGGVIAQLVVALPILSVATAFEGQDFGHAAPVVVALGYWSVMVALLNLAPLPGLDGHRAWRVVPLLVQAYRARKQRQ